MVNVSAVLAEARTVGLAVHVEADRLVVRGPRRHEAIAQRLLAEKPAVIALLAEVDVEVTWRVTAMRPQLPPRGPIPFLTVRATPSRRGACQSCGDPLLEDQRYRCPFCASAAQQLLHEVREGVGHE